MEKTDAIVIAVEVLLQRFGPDMVVEDHWDADRCAIGFVNRMASGRLAYLSTWQQYGRYFVSLEHPTDEGSGLPYGNTEEHDGLSLQEAVQLIGEHLRLIQVEK